MSEQKIWIDNTASRHYRFHDEHPFHPVRLQLTEELLTACGALHPLQMIAPMPMHAAERIIQAIHRPEYLKAVAALNTASPQLNDIESAAYYGLEVDGDTPHFPGILEASTAIVAGTLTAAEAVMSGNAKYALHLAGGLHHAFPNRAAGFCVLNDAAAAIHWIREKYDARVMYIDTDVHHGDGVQFFFYADPDVFTLSIHETGKFLFPGSGFHHERGEASGYGTCLNLPMEPYTEDDSWLSCFEIAIEKAVQTFKPDIIISQHGCDAHAFDPLAHIHCSMRIYREMPRMIRQFADQYTGGRWVALGGGGYDHWRVVPRAWALLWLEMSGHPLLHDIDRLPLGGPLPLQWPMHQTPNQPQQFPHTWLDDVSAWEPMPRRDEISAKNKKMLEIALQHL